MHGRTEMPCQRLLLEFWDIDWLLFRVIVFMATAPFMGN
jgi:hypothetical protein